MGGYQKAEPASVPRIGAGHDTMMMARLTEVGMLFVRIMQEWKRFRINAEELFDAATPELLDKVVMVKPLGEMSVIQCLGQVGLTHGMTHLGEIELARTLVGV